MIVAVEERLGDIGTILTRRLRVFFGDAVLAAGGGRFGSTWYDGERITELRGDSSRSGGGNRGEGRAGRPMLFGSKSCGISASGIASGAIASVATGGAPYPRTGVSEFSIGVGGRLRCP